MGNFTVPEIRCSICGRLADEEEIMGIVLSASEDLGIPIEEFLKVLVTVTFVCMDCVGMSAAYSSKANEN
jgi:hypothetical protein